MKPHIQTLPFDEKYLAKPVEKSVKNRVWAKNDYQNRDRTIFYARLARRELEGLNGDLFYGQNCDRPTIKNGR